MIRKKRIFGLFRVSELLLVGLLISLLFALFALTNSFSTLHNMLATAGLIQRSANQKPHYQVGQEVQVKLPGKYRDWIGKVSKRLANLDDKYRLNYHYEITFPTEQVSIHVGESDLTKADKAKFAKGDIVKLSSPKVKEDGNTYQGQLATVEKVKTHHAPSSGGYQYDMTLNDGQHLDGIPEKAIVVPYRIALKEENTAQENNQLLRKAFTYAQTHPNSILAFPKGQFRIGSITPDVDYAVLPSETAIVGNQTELIIQGTMYWFGFPTGPEAHQGVHHLTLAGIHFKASDLNKGNHFMIMADHGSDWHVYNNRFTMVHQRNSHLFDLGSLQNSLFEKNDFIGYAPELTEESGLLSKAGGHDFFSEAIQFDAATHRFAWDGDLLKKIAPNYDTFNQIRHLCHNITISQNQFLPYIDSKGKLKAYSGSIGQHSSEVGAITVINNVFASSIVSRANKEPSPSWFMEPIHFPPNSPVTIVGNTIN